MSPEPRLALPVARVAAWWRIAVVLLAATLAAWAGAASPGRADAAHARLVSVDGPIGPAAATQVRRAIEAAARAGAAVVVLRIDTPGGLDTSMREIVRAIVSAPVPVLCHVAPGGARAASAGTYILQACHVAAMAPGTNLGAATPVALGGDGAASGAAGASGAKAVNDAAAYLRSLATMRGRNADWAEQAVRASASLDAVAALERRVIDLVATDTADLLRRADGRRVRLAARDVTLATAGLALQEAPVGWRTRVLGVVGDPNVALILMTIGVYGLLFEFMSPGTGVPGTIGGIALVLGLYGLSALPLDLAGAALLVLGAALMIAEAFVPSFGVLGIAGVLAFVFGASVLVDEDGPGLGVSLPLVAGLAFAALAAGAVGVRLALRARRRRVASGVEAMRGAPARVLDWIAGSGHVQCEGERWRAEGPPTLRPGDPVLVRAVRGLTVEVEPAGGAAPPPGPSG